jgi:MFS family permease
MRDALINAGLYTPFVYVYQKALDLGTPKGTASIIISVLGIFNTLGRLFAGWLADRPWADSVMIHNVSAILAGIGTCVVPFLNSFPLLICYAIWFGSFVGQYVFCWCFIFSTRWRPVTC